MTFLATLILFTSLSFAQETVILSGTIRDAESLEAIASANVRVVNTSQGTVANVEAWENIWIASRSSFMVGRFILAKILSNLECGLYGQIHD